MKRRKPTKNHVAKKQKLDDWKTEPVNAIDRLPLEIWNIILLLCADADLLILSRTCHPFRLLLNEHAQIWYERLDKRISEAKWIHPLFYAKPKQLLTSLILKKCFECGVETSRRLEIGHPLITCFVCVDCSKTDTSSIHQISASRAMREYKLPKSQVDDLYCTHSYNEWKVYCSWIFVIDVKERAIKFFGSEDKLYERIAKGKKRSDAIKKGKEERANKRKLQNPTTEKEPYRVDPTTHAAQITKGKKRSNAKKKEKRVEL
jgi:hypothetical protein